MSRRTSRPTSPRSRHSRLPQLERLETRSLLADGTFFMGLGHLPVGALHSEAYDVSDDGSVVVGISRAVVQSSPTIWFTSPGDRAFRWTSGTGMQDLGTLPGSDRSKARAVSGDGSVVVGYSPPVTAGAFDASFRSTQATGMQGVGDLPGGGFGGGGAYGISSDGTWVVGASQSANGREAYRWNTATITMEALGDLPGGTFESTAWDVSADGSVVVGEGIDGNNYYQTFRWTEATGMVNLGPLYRGTGARTSAVSADGSAIVGWGHNPNIQGSQEAYRWTQATGMRPLGDLPGGEFYSIAQDVSGDGAVVVGYGTIAGGEAAFLWDTTHGMRNLRDVLVNEYGLGASLAGWTLSQAIGISADGTTIVGAGYNPAGKVEAWIVSLKQTIAVTPTSGLVTTEAGGTASFSVVLTTQPTADVTIPVHSSDTTEGTVLISSLTFTPSNWDVPQTVTVTGVDDDLTDGDVPYTIVLGLATSADPAYNGLDPADVSVVNLDDEVLPTKFYVVDDAGTDRTYEYGPDGSAVEHYGLGSGNTAPRGAASTAAGDRVWVVDANKKVYVYDTAGALLGSWAAGGLASNATVEGIATNGTDVWIVDARQDRVYRYTNAAGRLSGSQNAASNFALNGSNKGPKGITTDGQFLWVVNDAGTDAVFKYTLTGALLGSWTIVGAGSSPTGITIDPADVRHIWVVDSGTDRVYQFDSATSRTSGSQSPSTSFALAAGNGNPQGIADPPTGGSSSPAAGGEAAPPTRQVARAVGRRDLLDVALHEMGRPRSSATGGAIWVQTPQALGVGESLTQLATELLQGRRRVRPALRG